jgi:AraC family transcriptional regulator
MMTRWEAPGQIPSMQPVIHDLFHPEPAILGRLYDGVRSRGVGSRVVAMGYDTSAARSGGGSPLAYASPSVVFHRRGRRDFTYRRGGRVGHCEAGDGQVSLLPAGFTLDVSYHERCEGLVVGISEALAAEVAADLGVAAEFPLAAGLDDPALAAMAESLWAGSSGSSRFLDALGRAMLVHVFERHAGPTGRTAADTPGWLREALALVQRQMHRPIGLVEMAEASGLSRAHFARSFKRATGLTPLAYVARSRVERARDRLLIDPDVPLARVAAEVGFCDQSHLTGHFRRAFGTTPAALRRDRARTS